MIYNFTQIEDKGTHIKLSTSDGDSVRIPKDKFVSINDESGLVSIKTVGSRATIGTVPQDIWENQ